MKFLLDMNLFGGTWTDKKMDIVVAYAKAYLTIMNKQASWAKTIYFDGFAGSGSIGDDDEPAPARSVLFQDFVDTTEEARRGTALRILEIVDPKPFDMYYFVEKAEAHCIDLKAAVAASYCDRKVHVTQDDCNVKLAAMADFMQKHKEYRALAFVDPYGLSLKWSAVEALKGVGVDLWILVPTGIGANRVLVNNGQIPDPWFATLESFLGLSREEITRQFYRELHANSLFDGPSTQLVKERDTVNKLGRLYSERLKQVFTFVSDPFVMRNSVNSIMYHFMMATNNKAALKIANDVIKPKYRI